MDQKELELKAQYDTELSALNAQIAQLNKLKDFKEHTIEKVNEKLKLQTEAHDRLTKKHNETQKELEELKTQLTSDYERYYDLI